ncbi:MaoC/PaaZ C-terminal domain-containing protein [Anaerobacillus sp. MEB173]|uniref:MaoC/PaaZ C-terminal domain-containing protein n=1 Tax=Anaerobacillus sp. MEB173 TaxID=3383345 RepID=UPI003F91339D
MYINELEIGQKFVLEPVTISEEEIYRFAEKYDPQPIHIDKEFAINSIFNGIIASGFQTISLVWRKWINEGIHGNEIVGGLGMDNLRWKQPVYPNDTLLTEVEVLNTKLSSRGGRGTATFRFDIYNQNKELTTTFDVHAVLKART